MERDSPCREGSRAQFSTEQRGGECSPGCWAAGFAPTEPGRRWSEPVIPAGFLHKLVTFPLSLQQQDTCAAMHHQPRVISTKAPAGHWSSCTRTQKRNHSFPRDVMWFFSAWHWTVAACPWCYIWLTFHVFIFSFFCCFWLILWKVFWLINIPLNALVLSSVEQFLSKAPLYCI